MKDIKDFITESIVNESKKIEMEDAVEVFRDWLDNDDFSLDTSGSKHGTGWDALEQGNSIYDLIEWAAAWDDLASELDTDEDGLRDWLDENEDELSKELGIED